MEKTGFLSAVIVGIESLTGMPIAWFVALLAIVVIEVIMRLIPTKNQGSIFNTVIGFLGSIIDKVIPDNRK